MHIAVLAASGPTGHHLAMQALERGHTVTAMAREVARLQLPSSGQLISAQADVRQPESVKRAIAAADVVLSGLGVARGEQGTLMAGAAALIDAKAPRIVWLGAYGTGASAQRAGLLTRAILGLALRHQLDDKVAADKAILIAGGTVFHSARLTSGPLRVDHRTVPMAQAPRRLLPAGISRATVAAAMLDEAESAEHPAEIVIPLAH